MEGSAPREGEGIGQADLGDTLRSIEDPAALLEGLFANSPVAFQVFKSDGHCLLVNEAFRRLLGSAPPPEYCIFEDEIVARQGFVDVVRRAFAGETIRVPPIWYDAREHTKFVAEGRRVGIEVTLFPLRDATGAVAYVALCTKDVTAELELKDALAALSRSEELLRQSQKVEAVGRLAGGVAHDFNNLLSVVLSYTEILLRRTPESDPSRHELDEIRKASERAADLTRQLLALSRQQVLEPKVLSLNDVVDGIGNIMRRVLGEDIEVETRLAPNVGKVKADPGQLEQVLLNLVVNARDAMPEGGRLVVETAQVLVDEAYPDVAPGDYVMLAVSDTGAGMDRATQAKIFEPFFTTKEKGRGTGLGLATVLGIVQQSGGHVWVQSERGKGTTFKIYLPLCDAETTWTPPRARPLDAARGDESVLLVEDEPQVRAVAAQILKEAGYKVFRAATPLEALTIAERRAGLDLLLTDVVMPKMTGRELAERVRVLRPGVKTVFMSGYTDRQMLEHGALASEPYFLQKPFTSVSLLAKVREALDSEPARPV